MEKTQTELFNVDRTLFHLTESRLVAITKDILRDIINRHLVLLRLANRGSTSDPVWEIERRPLDFPIVADTRDEPDQRVLLNLIEILTSKVARGPSAPRVLTAQQLREVRERVRVGEDKSNIARYYGVDVAVVRQLAS